MTYQDTGLAPPIDDVTAGLFNLHLKRPRDDDGAMPPSKRPNFIPRSNSIGSTGKTVPSASSRPTSPAPVPQAAAKGQNSTPPPKKFVRGRRVLNGRQNNFAPGQPKPPSNKQAQTSAQQFNAPQNALSYAAPQHVHRQAQRPLKALYSVDSRQQYPTASNKPAPFPRNSYAATTPRYTPYQQNGQQQLSARSPQTYNNYRPNRGNNSNRGRNFNQRSPPQYRGSPNYDPIMPRTTQKPLVPYQGNRPYVPRGNRGGFNNKRMRRGDRNTYTRVYNDQLIDATTTFEGTDTVVTTVTQGMLCKNPRCENVHVHMPKQCPFKKQNF